MPFESKAQARACYAANDPSWDCEEFSAATDFSRLPARKKKPVMKKDANFYAGAVKAAYALPSSLLRSAPSVAGSMAKNWFSRAAKPMATQAAIGGGMGALGGGMEGGWGGAASGALSGAAQGAAFGGLGQVGAPGGKINTGFNRTMGGLQGRMWGGLAGGLGDVAAQAAGVDTGGALTGLGTMAGMGYGAARGTNFGRGLVQGAARPFTKAFEMAGQHAPGSMYSFGRNAIPYVGAGAPGTAQTLGRMAGMGAVGAGAAYGGYNALTGGIQDAVQTGVHQGGRAVAGDALTAIDKILPYWQHQAQQQFGQWGDQALQAKLQQLGLMDQSGQLTPLTPVYNQVGQLPGQAYNMIAQLLGGGQSQQQQAAAGPSDGNYMKAMQRSYATGGSGGGT